MRVWKGEDNTNNWDRQKEVEACERCRGFKDHVAGRYPLGGGKQEVATHEEEGDRRAKSMHSCIAYLWVLNFYFGTCWIVVYVALLNCWIRDEVMLYDGRAWLFLNTRVCIWGVWLSGRTNEGPAGAVRGRALKHLGGRIYPIRL